MKHIKCLKIAPETICVRLRASYQPFTVCDIELNLNELAASLIESLLEREMAAKNRNIDESIIQEVASRNKSAVHKMGHLIASYLIDR